MGSLGRLCCAAVAVLTLGTVFSDSYSVSAQLIISEFRVRGPNGANDEFIEIYNNSGADHIVTSGGGSIGYGVASSDGVARCVIPNGTNIPNRGHYLCVNSIGYSLSSYPAGNGMIATGDATYTLNIPDNAGIAIFNTSVPGNFILGNRMDAVGSTSEANTTYKEGTGYPALTPFSIDYSFYRDYCGKSGSITTFGECPIPGLPKDTNNNAADFVFVDTNGTSAGAGQRLGAPGPENMSSPIPSDALLTGVLLDTSLSKDEAPNRQRDGGAFCAPPNPVVLPCSPAQNSTFGTISFRRRIINNTGAPVTRIRFRIVDKTVFPAPSGIADMRARTSTAVVIATVNDAATCAAKIPPEAAPCSITVQGTTLEQPPGQPNGGGFNSTLSAGTVTVATPIAPGDSLNVQFVYGLQQMGHFKIWVNFEVLTDILPPAPGTDGGATFNKKKLFSPATSGGAGAASGATGPVDSGAAPAVAPARPVIPNVWIINPETNRAVPARVTRDVGPSAEEKEEKEKSEKKAEHEPATPERPAPADASEPVPANEAPAPAVVAPATKTAPVVPAATTTKTVAVRKAEASNSAQAQPVRKNRRAVARKRGTHRRR